MLPNRALEWVVQVRKALAGRADQGVEAKLFRNRIASAPDLELYEVMVLCRIPKFEVGLDLAAVLQMHPSPDRAADWMIRIAKGKIPGQCYMYALSPAHQARLAVGRAQNPVKERLVTQGEEYGIGTVDRPGAMNSMNDIFENAFQDDADRLKVARRRNFDHKWADGVLMERKNKEREEGRALLYGADGKEL